MNSDSYFNPENFGSEDLWTEDVVGLAILSIPDESTLWSFIVLFKALKAAMKHRGIVPTSSGGACVFSHLVFVFQVPDRTDLITCLRKIMGEWELLESCEIAWYDKAELYWRKSHAICPGDFAHYLKTNPEREAASLARMDELLKRCWPSAQTPPEHDSTQ